MAETICGVLDSVKITRPLHKFCIDVVSVIITSLAIFYLPSCDTVRKKTCLSSLIYYFISTDDTAYSLARWHADKCTLLLVQSQLPYHRLIVIININNKFAKLKRTVWHHDEGLRASVLRHSSTIYVSLYYVMFSFSMCHIVEYLSPVMILFINM